MSIPATGDKWAGLSRYLQPMTTQTDSNENLGSDIWHRYDYFRMPAEGVLPKTNRSYRQLDFRPVLNTPISFSVTQLSILEFLTPDSDLFSLLFSLLKLNQSRTVLWKCLTLKRFKLVQCNVNANAERNGSIITCSGIASNAMFENWFWPPLTFGPT